MIARSVGAKQHLTLLFNEQKDINIHTSGYLFSFDNVRLNAVTTF